MCEPFIYLQPMQGWEQVGTNRWGETGEGNVVGKIK